MKWLVAFAIALFPAASMAQVKPSQNIPTKTYVDTELGKRAPVLNKAPLTGAVDRTLAEKLFERLSIDDFYRGTDGADYLPAWNRAIAALPDTGGTIHFPRRASCYPTSGPLVAGNGSAAAASTKQNVVVIFDGGSGTGSQNGFGNDKGPCVEYTGNTVIPAIMQFNGPMSMGLENVTLRSGYAHLTGSPLISTTNGLNTIFNISSMTNIVVGAEVTAPGVPAGSIVVSISGNTAVISTNATATAANVQAQVAYNKSYADKGLLLNHVYRSKLQNVGIKNARVGFRQDAYGSAQGVSIGSSDNDFTNIWSENGAIAGGASGSGAFDIGNGDTGTGFQFDIARNTYTNLVGAYAGDPNATGLVLRYADNLTFRGGMMYSQREPGLGYAVAIIPPTGTGREPAFPAEITFQGMAMIGRIYEDPRWKPYSNGNFTINFWPMHAGDMMDPGNPGKGTLPSSGNFVGVDDRGVFFGWPQFRSWLNDLSGAPVAYDAPATVSRKTTLTQVTGVTVETVYATHKLPGNAMRARNSKDYPVGTFPLSDAAQFSYDRVVKLTQSGNWFNNNASANIQIIVRIGATTLWQSGNLNLAASQFYGGWRFEGELSQSGSASQSFNARLTIAQPGSAGGGALPAAFDIVANRETTIDLTGDQPITVSVVPSTTAFVWNASKSIATIH